MFVVVIPRIIQSWFSAGSSKSSLPKEDETSEEFKVSKKRFDAATTYVPHVVGKIHNNDLHDFYALYKQATNGDADDSQRPSFLDYKNRAKFDLWAKKRGMKMIDAMDSYVRKLLDLDLGFDPNDASLQTQGFGNKPSRMAMVEEQTDDEEFQDTDVKNWFSAVKANNSSALEPMIAKKPELLNFRDHNMNITALHWAVDIGWHDTVITLLNLGADVNSKDAENNTPLHYATLCGRKDLVDLLLSRGAKMDSRNAEGERPIDCCDREIFEYLLLLESDQ
ncbi:unnamed protein product [Auanema sp. JU1783]|nr:unnamed protein product [Auanema sp. JU1783]